MALFESIGMPSLESLREEIRYWTATKPADSSSNEVTHQDISQESCSSINLESPAVLLRSPRTPKKLNECYSLTNILLMQSIDDSCNTNLTNLDIDHAETTSFEISPASSVSTNSSKETVDDTASSTLSLKEKLKQLQLKNAFYRNTINTKYNNNGIHNNANDNSIVKSATKSQRHSIKSSTLKNSKTISASYKYNRKVMSTAALVENPADIFNLYTPTTEIISGSNSIPSGAKIQCKSSHRSLEGEKKKDTYHHPNRKFKTIANQKTATVVNRKQVPSATEEIGSCGVGTGNGGVHIKSINDYINLSKLV